MNPGEEDQGESTGIATDFYNGIGVKYGLGDGNFAISQITGELTLEEEEISSH
jgi:hypothetical protein